MVGALIDGKMSMEDLRIANIENKTIAITKTKIVTDLRSAN
jgi:hypothetical protein